ncbi:hypothetical protein ES705_16309 [subsurface metagenome]
MSNDRFYEYVLMVLVVTLLTGYIYAMYQRHKH